MPQIRINIIVILVLRHLVLRHLRHLYFEALRKTNIPIFQYSNHSRSIKYKKEHIIIELKINK